MKKLSARQRSVLEQMRDGRELHHDRTSFALGWSLVGREAGSRWTRVHSATAVALLTRRLIAAVPGQSIYATVTLYRITDAGRNALEERP